MKKVRKQDPNWEIYTTHIIKVCKYVTMHFAEEKDCVNTFSLILQISMAKPLYKTIIRLKR